MKLEITYHSCSFISTSKFSSFLLHRLEKILSEKYLQMIPALCFKSCLTVSGCASIKMIWTLEKWLEVLFQSWNEHWQPGAFLINISDKKYPVFKISSKTIRYCDWITIHFENSMFSSVAQLFRLFVTPWTAACQASLSITDSWSPPKPMSIESVMPSNHLILCCPLLLLPSIFPSIRVSTKLIKLSLNWFLMLHGYDVTIIFLYNLCEQKCSSLNFKKSSVELQSS